MTTVNQDAAASHVAAHSDAAPAKAAEYLAFTLGQEEYGIDIQKVSEIRSYESPTRIANAPAFVKGVVNLRGIIVPIVDMRIKFNLGEPSYDQFTVVIILNIGTRVVGMVVDRVSDVTTLLPEQIKQAPDMGGALNTDYVIGLGTLDERMLILVDIDQLMSSPEMGLIERLAA
ncbi:chemotaxis protein CheW [Janthinobacterium fluminis]|uniref:Chemotaxis protein CheW n=1 Tax=Janthinobacterium fluminis TaxID=2987524 RepID=A0ABT5JVT3_9BURK|nr:chemotaxis protein CheW [Janthinobacterium fluminis]MDC8756540.1 chemotaxis protein CheW [Janthinobacterium fluminis]